MQKRTVKIDWKEQSISFKEFLKKFYRKFKTFGFWGNDEIYILSQNSFLHGKLTEL